MKRLVLALAAGALLAVGVYGQSTSGSSEPDNRVQLQRIAQDDRVERREEKAERKRERREEKRERKRHKRHRKHQKGQI